MARKTVELDCGLMTFRGVDVTGAASAENESLVNGDGDGTAWTTGSLDGPSLAAEDGRVFTLLVLVGTAAATGLGLTDTAVAGCEFVLEGTELE